MAWFLSYLGDRSQIFRVDGCDSVPFPVNCKVNRKVTEDVFYIKGVAPPEITIRTIYRGIVPFVVLQLAGLALLIIWPKLKAAIRYPKK